MLWSQYRYVFDQYYLITYSGVDPDPELPKFQSWIQIQNKSVRIHNTDYKHNE